MLQDYLYAVISLDASAGQAQTQGRKAVESKEYEFNSRENELIRGLASKMNFVAILMIAGGILGILAGVIILVGRVSNSTQGPSLDLSSLVQGIFLLVTGIWTRTAAIAFKQVVQTTGRDIENLMAALKELRKLYTLQYWLAIVLLVLLAIALFITVVAAIASLGGG